MSIYEEEQLNGVCWSCGEIGADPVYQDEGEPRTIGQLWWRCQCGVQWQCRVEDLANWVHAYHCEYIGEYAQYKLPRGVCPGCTYKNGDVPVVVTPMSMAGNLCCPNCGVPMGCSSDGPVKKDVGIENPYKRGA
jgi:hypothetical protein